LRRGQTGKFIRFLIGGPVMVKKGVILVGALILLCVMLGLTQNLQPESAEAATETAFVGQVPNAKLVKEDLGKRLEFKDAIKMPGVRVYLIRDKETGSEFLVSDTGEVAIVPRE